MNLSDFDYELPKELIAQEALAKRPDARLLALNRETGKIQHRHFRDCPDLFEAGDILVLNDTKVLPARLFAKKETGGSVEVLLLEEKEKNIWKTLVKPSGRVRENQALAFEGHGISIAAKALDAPSGQDGIRHLQFLGSGNIRTVLEKIGRIPLPPYIDRPDTEIDYELYQTVFARKPGAVASPTAGLHFDRGLLQQIESKGVEVLCVTLHVSYGTFQPVTCDNPAEHKMYAESFDIPDETAEKINMAKSAGRRIIACGTTVVRTLESTANDAFPSEVRAGSGKTSLFIYPPYEFKIIDGMITNFHLPRTTLLMLTAAFCGMDNLKRSYAEAIRERYRFYSYGDGMMVT